LIARPLSAAKHLHCSDVEHKVFDRLAGGPWFYPGHGNDSTLGRERPSLPEWRARGW